jgi:hypothetical protein
MMDAERITEGGKSMSAHPGNSNQFQLKRTQDAGVTHLTLSGPIDESAKLPSLAEGEEAVVDLAGVSRLNSTGTRSWCMWMQAIPASAKIVFTNCPVIMVKNFVDIRGFLKPNCRVDSFAVPYYSVDTDERLDFILKRGEHFDSGGSLKLPSPKDSRGNEMELDVTSNKYFQFLSFK